MDVLREILSWSETRPEWQRDALSRLAANGELTDEDIVELIEICKSKHGLAEAKELNLLTEDKLPTIDTDAGYVNVQSIYHHCGVNALAENQTVNFGLGLTVVYGDNAAGKSGYTRIFKSACRTRGTEYILGNVASDSAPVATSVKIKYSVGDNGVEHVWAGEGSAEPISRVSVFDSHSATVYLTEKTDVAFRPFGLDLFDKLAQTSKSIQDRLEHEKRALGTGGLHLDLPEGTVAAKFIASISSLTKPEKVVELGTLSEEEIERSKLLEKQLLDMRAKDPAKAAQELKLRAGRLGSLAEQLKMVEYSLTNEAVQTVFKEQEDVQKKSETSKKLRSETFPDGMLSETGSNNWVEMWEAARIFSESGAYPDKLFPVTDDGAQCLLCQQDIKEEASERLKQFELFVISVVEKEFRDARNLYARHYKELDELNIKNDAVDKGVEDVRIEAAELAEELIIAIKASKDRCKAVIDGLKVKKGLPSDLPENVSIVSKVNGLISQLSERVDALQKQSGAEEVVKIEKELQELNARKILGKSEKQILGEIDRKKKIAAYGLCIYDTRTQGITAKSTAITKVVVTEKLKKSFQHELKKLKFKHVDVELTESGGSLGNLYHKLVLTKAPGVVLPRVVSEGEQRCLSIAAFFAELSTADDPSAILFDDPVSSLDYKWRDSVAQRLVEEAKHRQVMVFTHDVVFLLQLKQYAKQQSVNMMDQHIKQIDPIGAGICEQEVPWIAMKVSKRISVLNNSLQGTVKLFNEGHQASYEKVAVRIYGQLRETWERGIEEVLLCGVVERFRVGVQTQQIETISDITLEDCQAVENGMTKCSKWLLGHDQAAAAPQDIPEPDELQQDIDALDNWIKVIRARR